MVKSSAFLGAILVVAGTAAAEAPKKSTAALDTLLKTAVEKKEVPLVVAVVVSGDAVVYQGAVGAPADAIFEIASMTKPLTSVAAMQLVEAGKVKLDDPASKYLPELGAVQVVEGETLRASKSPITVRHLLTHTSGFAYEFLNPTLLGLVQKGKVASVMAGGDAYLKAPLMFDPGTKWEYGISTDWVGRLIEKVSGQTLDAYLRQHVLEPLGMSDTYFNVPPEKQARLLPHHQRQPDGSLQVQPRQPQPPVTFFSGGGGLFSTAADYVKFMRALMNGGRLGQARIVSAESIAQMGSNQIGDLPLTIPNSIIPQLAKPHATIPGRPDKFGFGFALNTAPIEKGRGANTMGWAGIFNTFFWIDREKKVSAVLLTQMLPFLDDGPQDLVLDFDRTVYAWLEGRD